ncbi:MAG: hypothetical protein AUG49_06605 [Catenulispora sp. 13_1_20CM_3_70_7]|nr:MAG: hypothetical protein AUG49_06605 [Catenulispora sp. 13_1_20CM_3_70_7]
MESLTKRRLEAGTLDALIAGAFGPQVGIKDRRELSDGFFNAAFRLLLTDGRDVVLKASPPPGAALLTYERDIMRAEVEFFRAAAMTGVPLPELLHAGFDRGLIDGDYVVLSAVDGVTWDSVRSSLEESSTSALRRELGGYLARLHRVSNPKSTTPSDTASPCRCPATNCWTWSGGTGRRWPASARRPWCTSTCGPATS